MIKIKVKIKKIVIKIPAKFETSFYYSDILSYQLFKTEKVEKTLVIGRN
jgi:hypothetical protein